MRLRGVPTAAEAVPRRDANIGCRRPAKQVEGPMHRGCASVPTAWRNRKSLGLSAADFGLFVGATGAVNLRVRRWQGKVQAQGASCDRLRGIGKREVEARLANIEGQPETQP